MSHLIVIGGSAFVLFVMYLFVDMVLYHFGYIRYDQTFAFKLNSAAVDGIPSQAEKK